MDKINIAFFMMGGTKWTVGPIYLRNLFHAIQKTYGANVGLYLLLAEEESVESNANYKGLCNIISYGKPRRLSPIWAINGLNKRLFSRNFFMERILKKHKIDVLFDPSNIYRYNEIPTLSWFWDFQHIHFPGMFSKKECVYRDRAVLKTAKLSSRIILMSESVKRDFEAFAPQYSHKTRVVNPVSYIDSSVYDSDPKSVIDLYNLPERFIYLPNQFWKHKNHEIAFKAIKIVKERGTNVLIVCTGNPSDYRHLSHFADLWRKLSQWNIREQVIYLGMVPHKHVLLLMRQSICVINPSLFEGWGFTVEEARSIGKQILLSDIPAHREQNPSKATFFNPNYCRDLAERLEELWEKSSPGSDMKLEREARKNLTKRIQAYARSFMSVVMEVAK